MFSECLRARSTASRARTRSSKRLPSEPKVATVRYLYFYLSSDNRIRFTAHSGQCLKPFARIHQVSHSDANLVQSIASTGGRTVPVDRRPKLNERLMHRVVAQHSSSQNNRSNMTEIVSIHAREILDSRGNPTVEADVILNGGAKGRAAVPSGASTGEHEAVELRDGDMDHYLGKGVLGAVENVESILAPELTGVDGSNQRLIDDTMLAIRPTEHY